MHASFGDSIFLVEDEKDAAGAAVMRARRQAVEGGPPAIRQDGVAARGLHRRHRGVKGGEEVVTAGGFKLRNRARVG